MIDTIARALKTGIGLFVIPLAVGFAGCEPAPEAEPDVEPMTEDVEGVEMEMGVGDLAGQIVTASLSPVNDHLTDGTPSGEVHLEVQGDSLVISVEASGVPGSMMHLQHFHGFEDGTAARCPGPDADANGDGVIDVTETAELAGTTMVPFHGDPASMAIPAETYPRAGPAGSYSYRQAVHLDSLRAAFTAQFDATYLRLEDRVVFVHGVPADTDLPETAASVPGVPVHVTLPIACGDLEGETMP